jgi:uracil-DNA glycosylase
MSFELDPHDLLRWYLDSGVDEAIGESAVDRFAASARAPVRSVPAAVAATAAPPPPPAPSSGSAAHLAAACATLAELRKTIEGFDGLAIKKTATSTVFADGNPDAQVMIIGEAPGPDEDRQGLPFVGKTGKLLDRMLASIGLDRTTSYMTTVLPWRLLENRKPSPDEVAMCLPFVTRHIELIDPQLLILLGGVASSALLARPEGFNRLRGRWFDYASPGLSRPIPALATFPPAYLLSTPEAKRGAWRDLLMVRKRLDHSAKVAL